MNTHEGFNLFKEQKDILLGMYHDSRTHLRHYEAQRSTASNIIIVTTVALIGFMAQGGLTCADWPLSVGLTFLGIYGYLFIAILFERALCHRDRAAAYYGELKELDTFLLRREEPKEGQELTKTYHPKTLEEIQVASDKEHDKLVRLRDLPFVSKCRVLWPLVISFIGVLITVYVFFLWRLSLCPPR